MKNLMFILFLAIPFLSFGQKVGVMFAPQGSVSLLEPQKGFSTSIPVVFMAVFVKDKYVLIPRYNMSNNSAGVILSRDLNHKLGGYCIGMKNLRNKNGYIGLGLTRQVTEKDRFFIEVGSQIKSIKPELSVGILVPFFL